ncbi:hypothetical protein [Neptunomonas marina]|uniref:DUF805 domain-containing protein n=1 Tax=Neptunomonas marina TaxID=1815562 RepID=A0A437QEA1_9GAMM|nr:hypothetical protein [Neptunomonas marina]RVU32892.1 hypothetical protein EOE65_04345 [Neptunomonas marina]
MAYIIIVSIWALIAFAGWRVFSRAGFKGAMGILFLIPVANFVALLYLAHKDWPAIDTKN